MKQELIEEIDKVIEKLCKEILDNQVTTNSKDVDTLAALITARVIMENGQSSTNIWPPVNIICGKGSACGGSSSYPVINGGCG